MIDPTVLIIASACIMAIIVSGRLAHTMGRRWGIEAHSSDWMMFFVVIGAACAAILAGFGAAAAVSAGGLLMGVLAVIATLPCVGFTWIFIVGGNKAIERVITGLLNKVDTQS